MSEDESIWSERIESGIREHRLVTGKLHVRGPAGVEIPPGTKCEIRQTGHAFKFGCLLNGWGVCPDVTTEDLFRERFAAVFNYASVLFHWGKSLSQRTEYEFADGQTEYRQRDAMIRWCEAHEIVVKGHPLVFFFQPDWVVDRPAGDPEKLLWRRVQREAADFAGRLQYWETVNESSWQGERAMEFNAVASRDTFARLGAKETIAETHRLVEAVDPEVRFILNESYPTEEFHRLLGDVLDSGIRVDAIGFQNHGLTQCLNPDELWSLCDEWGRFGVPLHFTELMMPSCSHEGRPHIVYEMAVNRAWPTCAEGEARQADELELSYGALFSHPAVEAITWWGLSDYLSCLDAPVGLLRADMSPKPAYERLNELLTSRWRTRTTSCIDGDGGVVFQGFAGRYELCLTTLAGDTLTGVFDCTGTPDPVQVAVRPETGD